MITMLKTRKLALEASVTPTAVLDNEAEGVTVKVHTTANNGLVVYLVNTSGKDYNGNISLSNIHPNFRSAINLLDDKEIEFIHNWDAINFRTELKAKRSVVLWFK